MSLVTDGRNYYVNHDMLLSVPVTHRKNAC